MGSVPAACHSNLSPLVLTGLLLIACCGLFYGYLVHPLRQELEEIQNHILSLRLALSAKETGGIRLANSSALLNKQQKYLNILLSPFRKQPINILQSLQNLASANKIEIRWEAPSIERTPRGVNEVEDVPYQLVTVHLEGAYHNLRNYLEGACHLDRILAIENYEIVTTKSDPRHAPALRAKLTLQVPILESRRDENLTNP